MKEEQIWQRVMAARETPQENGLKFHAMQCVEAIGEYTALQRSPKGKIQHLAGELNRQEQQILQCLRGLQSLQEGTSMQLPKSPARQTPDRRTLIRRYHSTRRAMTESMSRSAENEWGNVFQSIAKLQESQCFLLAQLLGVM